MERKQYVDLSIIESKVPAGLVNKGNVSLVGAGPGDPDLLTVKALRVINQADLIIYDNLVSDEIRALFPKSTQTLYVGKGKNIPSIEQSHINQLLADKALKGLRVCRLKGGDSFVFGRGGEEMLYLKQQGVEVDIVPGITAAAGCSAYAGIPLTHRGIAQGCTFVTAHAETKLQANWSALAALNHTLVFYMGLSKAPMIANKLISSGLTATTPVALIEKGCSAQQRVLQGQLADLSHLVKQHQLQSPTLIIVGEVVNLAQHLSWFESQAYQTQGETKDCDLLDVPMSA